MLRQPTEIAGPDCCGPWSSKRVAGRWLHWRRRVLSCFDSSCITVGNGELLASPVWWAVGGPGCIRQNGILARGRAHVAPPSSIW